MDYETHLCVCVFEYFLVHIQAFSQQCSVGAVVARSTPLCGPGLQSQVFIHRAELSCDRNKVTFHCSPFISKTMSVFMRRHFRKCDCCRTRLRIMFSCTTAALSILCYNHTLSQMPGPSINFLLFPNDRFECDVISNLLMTSTHTQSKLKRFTVLQLTHTHTGQVHWYVLIETPENSCMKSLQSTFSLEELVTIFIQLPKIERY